jgi:nicotinate-nucleotide adenylyltransferase
MRIGIFGGTFDPVHLGHLILAEQCREQARLDQVWFIPAARPPHKGGRDLTPFAQRVEMLALAIAGQPAFRINELEKDRPGPSYTADTLAELHRTNSGAEFFLLVGSDTLADLPNWHEPARVVQLATVLFVNRLDAHVTDEDALLRIAARPYEPRIVDLQSSERTIDLALGVPLRYQRILMPLIDIASRDLRRRVADGKSVRYLVPRAVEAYILDKRLYQPGA